jgi:hypothetical protein
VNLQRLNTIWALSREGAGRYRTNALRIFLRLGHLSRKFRVNPEEACRVGIVDPALSDAEISRRFISKYLLQKIQTQYNPKSHFGITEDKAIFAAFCQGHSVPHPKLLAAFSPQGGWAGEGGAIHGRADWEKFFTEQLPERFVLKPTAGWHGNDVSVLTRNGALFEDNEGIERDAAQLYDFLMSSGDSNSRWVLQEVLANHPELVRLTGSGAISTCRMITLVDATGRTRLFHAHLRSIVGENVVDNIKYGQTGNLVSGVDLENGALSETKRAASKWGCDEVEAHPGTGVSFRSFRVPDWGKARDLVLAIAPKFLPARALGWDVAFTPEGPVVIEGNACWDPVNSLECSPRVIEPFREDYLKLL